MDAHGSPVLQNARRFPRVRIRCEVIYNKGVIPCQSYTKDISFGGCRIAGYYPFAPGKTLPLVLAHPICHDRISVVAKVIRACGGADNYLAFEFQDGTAAYEQFEGWIYRVISSDSSAQRVFRATPNCLPLEAMLRKAPTVKINRLLSKSEQAVMEALDKAPYGVTLKALSKGWGREWEARARVLFGLIGDRVVLASGLEGQPTPAGPMTPKSTSASELEGHKVARELLSGLKREFGSGLGKQFARHLVAIAEELEEEKLATKPQPEEESSNELGRQSLSGRLPTRSRPGSQR